MARLVRAQGVIGYDDSGGEGPVVVVVPGMGDLRSEYRFLVPRLVEAGYRVVSLDIRGHGESDGAWSDFSARAIAEDVLALLDHLGVARAQVCGASFAAGTALWAAALAPERIASAVLFGPILRDLPQPWWVRGLVAAGFAGPWRVAFWMTYWASLFPEARAPDHAAVAASLRADLKKPGHAEALRHMIFLSKAETEALLPRVRLPVLAVVGSKDPDYADPSAELDWVCGALSAEPLLLEGIGHYPQIEAIDTVAPRVIDFLGRTR